MRLNFYLKLSISNIIKNKKNYVPYLLSNIVVISVFFSFCVLYNNVPLYSEFGVMTMDYILGLGIYVLGFFALIFMFYTNSFLFKRRKKELGLYNVLGMEKRHLSIMMGCESLLIALLSIGGGLILGMLFYKFAELLLFKILQQPIIEGFHFSIKAFCTTIQLFLLIFLAIFLYNIYQIRQVNAIELLSSTKAGEKEPKANYLVAILGLICLMGGYGLAQKVPFEPSALLFFFPAVMLVIIGTYCLFISLSVVILKLLKKNKKFYYHPLHFTLLSQMIYRMKQNAVGLANICILSTMVIVTLSTTIALYVGVNDLANSFCPYDVVISIYHDNNALTEDYSGALVNLEQLNERIQSFAQDENVTLSNINMHHQVQADFVRDGQNFYLNENTPYQEVCPIYFVPQEYLPDLPQPLKDDEIYLYQGNQHLFDAGQELNFPQQTYQIAEIIEESQIPSLKHEIMDQSLIIVIPEEADFELLFENQESCFGLSVYQFDLANQDEDIIYEKLYPELFGEDGEVGRYNGRCLTRQSYLEASMALYGGLFFVGLFLGAVFMIATILIIYYKQISEGYDDVTRFEVMKKVGMSNDEVKKTIRTQILWIFFLPLIVACCHMVFAFRLIQMILYFLTLTNTLLFALACLCVVIVFGICYCLIFMITSKEYYQIVSYRA